MRKFSTRFGKDQLFIHQYGQMTKQMFYNLFTQSTCTIQPVEFWSTSSVMWTYFQKIMTISQLSKDEESTHQPQPSTNNSKPGTSSINIDANTTINDKQGTTNQIQPKQHSLLLAHIKLWLASGKEALYIKTTTRMKLGKQSTPTLVQPLWK